YVDALRARIAALPAVADVALADHAPFFIGFERKTKVGPDGGECAAGGCPSYPTYAVSAGYFRTMGIPLVEGRELEEGGSAAQVVVNQPFARKQWLGRDALGRSVGLRA